MASSEGLEDPLVLNTLTPLRVIIDYKPDSDSGPYWHRYLLKLPEEKVQAITKKFSKLMKHGWYSIFWNDTTVYVIFSKKVFIVKRERVWKSEEYRELQQYAFTHGLQAEYFDFNERFRHYNSLLKKYNK